MPRRPTTQRPCSRSRSRPPAGQGPRGRLTSSPANSDATHDQQHRRRHGQRGDRRSGGDRPSDVDQFTAGQTVTVDSAVTVSSADTNVTGATCRSRPAIQTGDTLHFTAQNGITIASNTGGVLTLTGTTTPANYQTALQSVTYSSTSTSTATRTISIVVSDSNANTRNSNTATTQILVAPPITVTGAWVGNPGWGATGTSNFLAYLASHSLGSATLGYALKTGAAQLTDLPFNNINTISVSLQRTGQQHRPRLAEAGRWHGRWFNWGGHRGSFGHGLHRPTAATRIRGPCRATLTNNKYVFAIATTGSSFGTLGSTQVTDANGAGISGTFTTSSSTFSPSGNGLAGSTFDFFFNVLPATAIRMPSVNPSDTAGARPWSTITENAANYNPYFDYNGAGVIDTVDSRTGCHRRERQTVGHHRADDAVDSQVRWDGGSDSLPTGPRRARDGCQQHDEQFVDGEQPDQWRQHDNAGHDYI